MIRALGILKLAAAKANTELGILPATISDPIQQAATRSHERKTGRAFSAGGFSNWLRHTIEHECE